MLSTNLLKYWTRMYYSKLEYGIQQSLQSLVSYSLKWTIIAVFVGNIRINAKLPNITILSGKTNQSMYIQSDIFEYIFTSFETPYENENKINLMSLPGNGVSNPSILFGFSGVLLGNHLSGRA